MTSLQILSSVYWAADPVLLELPQLFGFGPLKIRWYGLFFALAFIFGFIIVSKIFKRESKPAVLLDPLLNYMVIGTLLGARLGHCLFYEPQYYLSNPVEILKFWRGGLASHGGAVGIFASLYLFSRKHPEIPYLWLLSRMSIVVALGGFFIRLGNFFNSEIIGIVAAGALPWSVVFARVDLLPRHPAQLYESLSYLLIFVFLYSRYLKSAGLLNPQILLGQFLTGIFTARFVIEFFKAEQTDLTAGLPLVMGQILSIPFIVFGIYLIVQSKRTTYGNNN